MSKNNKRTKRKIAVGSALILLMWVVSLLSDMTHEGAVGNEFICGCRVKL